MYKAPKPST
ncbi:unnamed protein product, partial [Rotaria sp. Silwood1]